MKNWIADPTNSTGNANKREAVTQLKEKIKDNPQLRERCIRYRSVARRTFADCGQFYLEEDGNAPAGFHPMPADIEVVILDGADLGARSKLITLVLRDVADGSGEQADPTKVWLCTYPVY